MVDDDRAIQNTFNAATRNISQNTVLTFLCPDCCFEAPLMTDCAQAIIKAGVVQSNGYMTTPV
jgi:hypothetical protein